MTTQSTTLTVKMHHDLVEQLDQCFSPADGIEAIDQVFIDLPIAHQALPARRGGRGRGRTLPRYRGRFGWFDLGFTYVQIGIELHVVELWHDDRWNKPRRREVDVVLGERTESGRSS